MAGNEQSVVAYLINNKNRLVLRHIGVVKAIGNPSANGALVELDNSDQLITTEDAGKKADIYINGVGVSIKQSGSSFLFNRLQRANLLNIFVTLGFSNPNQTLSTIDGLINNFHAGLFTTRDRHWSEGFSRADFVAILEYLMMKGSPNLGNSAHPATFILTAPKNHINDSNISCDTFQEYFLKYEDKIFLSLRRQWVGQSSDSEHKRSVGLNSKPNNAPWCFKTIVGSPRSGWRMPSEFPILDRRTVYMIFITVKP